MKVRTMKGTGKTRVVMETKSQTASLTVQGVAVGRKRPGATK